MIRKIAQIFAILFIFAIPLENSFTLGSLGSVSRLIGLAAAGLWLISVIFENKIRAFNYFHILAFIFLLFNVASILWTVDFDITLIRVKTYSQILIQIWMLWDLLTTEKMYRAALLAFILGAYFTVIDTISNFISGQIISQWEYGRYTGAGQNAVELALILSLCIPIAWYLATNQKATHIGKLIKIICLSFLPTSLFAIILTGSRTALLTLIPGVIYIVTSFRQFKAVYRYLGFFFLIVLILIGQSLIPQATLDRLGTIDNSISSGDFGGRGVLWSQGIQIFYDHPLLGIGSGSIASPDQLGTVIHNTFLSVLVELGIIGLFIFLFLIGSAILQAMKLPWSARTLWLTVLSIWVIGVLTLTYEYAKPTWLFLSLIAISANTIKQPEVTEINKLTKEQQSSFQKTLHII